VVAVGLQVWAITASTFAVSLVGVLGLVPLIVAGLYGGVLVDALDRRRVLLGASMLMWTTTLALACVTWSGSVPLALLYILAVANSVGGALVMIARTAVIAQLVRPGLLPAAAALFGIASGLFVTVGPALAGVLVATAGLAWTYSIDAALFLAALIAAWRLPTLRAVGSRTTIGLRSVVEGLTFLRRSEVIRVSFLADLVAMTFARPHALFPAVGAVVIGGGAPTVGALTAAVAAGAMGLGLFSGPLSRAPRQGLVVAWSVAVYGASIAALGVIVLCTGVRGADANPAPLPFFLALAVLALAGGSDEASALFRTAILQTAAPDGMHGRLQGVFTVVVNGGPRLGDLWIGILATVSMLWVPLVLGGLIVVVTIAFLVRASRDFRGYPVNSQLARTRSQQPPKGDENSRA
jgi:hypothetical protein